MLHSPKLRRQSPNRRTPLRPAGKKRWNWTIFELLIFSENKLWKKFFEWMSPAAAQRRCIWAVQASAPSAGGPTVMVGRHTLNKGGSGLNFYTFKYSPFWKFILPIQNIDLFNNINNTYTCLVLNILEGCGKYSQKYLHSQTSISTCLVLNILECCGIYSHFQIFTQIFTSISVIVTCLVLNILEGCGKPGKPAVAVKRAKAQVERDNAVPRQAT